jgi:hypothetical protein
LSPKKYLPGAMKIISFVTLCEASGGFAGPNRLDGKRNRF